MLVLRQDALLIQTLYIHQLVQDCSVTLTQVPQPGTDTSRNTSLTRASMATVQTHDLALQGPMGYASQAPRSTGLNPMVGVGRGSGG